MPIYCILKGKFQEELEYLTNAKKYLNTATLITLYYSFVYPYFNYCNCIWGNTFPTYLEPLVKLQKRAIRIISHADRKAHTLPLFEKLKLLNISKSYIYWVQLFMYKYKHKLVPNIFSNFFKFNHEVHSYPTRQRNLLHVTSDKLISVRKTLRTSGVAMYNHFVSRLGIDCSFVSYKKHLKEFLIGNDVSTLLE